MAGGDDCSGTLTSAIFMIVVVWPAVDTPIFLVPISPRVVSTPVTSPFGPRRMPVTSQFWMMSTPRALAARA